MAQHFWPVPRVEFIMALLKECGNTNDLPEENGDGSWLEYLLTGDEKSGYVVEHYFAGDEIIYTFGEVSC